MSDGVWTALLLAGERPGENQFASAHGVPAKALIRVGGEPMLGRVTQVLLRAPSVRRIVVLAQQPADLMSGSLGWMAADPRISSIRSGEGISTSIGAVAGTTEAPYPVLVVTADHALLTVAMIEAFLAESEDCDIAAALVERAVVESSYPETKRTWLRFSDGDYSGANLFALRTERAQRALDIWAGVERDRKKALRLLLSFGAVLALRAITRTITLDAALRSASRRVGVNVRAVRLPFAEAAIDVDKPSDLALAERILAGRSLTSQHEQKEEQCASPTS